MSWKLTFGILISLSSWGATPATSIPDRVMSYYEIGKENPPLLYRHRIQYEALPDGLMSTKSTVTDPKGNLIYSESIVSRGSKPISHVADVYQTKRRLELEVKEGRVYFKTKGLNAENPEPLKEDQDKLPDTFITGALAEPFIVEHFDEILRDETVHTKMGVLELREVVSFKFWKKEQIKVKDRDVIVIAMKPTSIFISMIVDTIHFYFDLKEKRMIRYIGRTPLWKEVDGKLRALDADLWVENSAPELRVSK